MDPVSLVEALAAGAAIAAGAGAAEGLTELVRTGIVEAYTACEKAVRARFGDDEDAKETLAQLEVRPGSSPLREALIGHVTTSGAGEDPVVVRAGETLRLHLARIEGGVGSISTGAIGATTVTADRGGIAGVNITGGATAGYTAPRSDDGPSK